MESALRNFQQLIDDGKSVLAADRPILNGFQFFMLAASLLLLGISVTGIWLTSDSEWKSLPITGTLLILPMLVLPGLFWHERREYSKGDAALTFPWIFLLRLFIPCIAILSCKLRLPLRDDLFVNMDHALGFSVPGIMAWMSKHRSVSVVLNDSYPLLTYLIVSAALVPALAGKREAAQRFLIAVTISFLIAVPVFTLLPGIGPWVGYHFTASADQKVCEAAIMALRSGSESRPNGIICFPSFHVIWAILSAVALWSIKPLRVPSSILAVLIVASTVTTGWHYVSDVLAGFVYAGISLACADALMRWMNRNGMRDSRQEHCLVATRPSLGR